MASPTIESLCCLTSRNEFSKSFLIDFHTLSYNIVSIFASVLGIIGALFQIFRKQSSSSLRSSRQNQFLKTRGIIIIKWLALADLMAAIGILIRSISWVTDKTFGASETDSLLGQIFCIVTSGWIHFFYTATYMWTFIYALDVKLSLKEKKLNPNIYQLIGWCLPAILCLTGLLFLYLPDLNCYNYSINPYLRFLPNYQSTFVPISFVMVANPVLYFVSFSSIESLISSSLGRFTQRERKIVHNVKIKFLLINLVFLLCWLPNIINGIILWTSWKSVPKAFIVVVWYLMAILNPLQAVFNTFVYRSLSSDAQTHTHFLGQQHIPFSRSLSSEIEHDSSSGEEQNDLDVAYEEPKPWQRIFHLRHPSERTPLLTSKYDTKEPQKESGSSEELVEHHL